MSEYTLTKLTREEEKEVLRRKDKACPVTGEYCLFSGEDECETCDGPNEDNDPVFSNR